MTNVDRLSGISDGLGRKAPVRVATTANITLSGLQSIDGVSVAEADRVLVKNQTSSVGNGIYNASSGTWTRATDFDGARDVVKGTSVLVASGSTNILTEWVVTASDPITIDSTSLTFGQTTIPATFNGAVTAEATVASASTTDIGAAASMKVQVTGVVTITSLGSTINTLRYVRFAGILTLTHNASTLILPGAANITTAAGDTAIFASDGSGNWRCWEYQRVTGAMSVPGQGQTEVTVASATTTNIGTAESDRVLISGTVTITSLGTSANKVRFVRFSGALTLTHNASSLFLPNAGSNITTAANDTAVFSSDASGNWRCYSYHRASGQALQIAAIASDTITLAMVRSELNGGISAAAKTLLGLNKLPLLYQGLNAGSYTNSHQMYFNPGTFADSTGDTFAMTTLPQLVDVNTVGINTGGAVVGFSPIIGGMAEGAPSSPVDLSFYACTRNSDNVVAFLASSFGTYGGMAPYVPAGWTVKRKMHFSVTYATGRGANWNGIPDFFQDIDNSRTVLTGFESTSNYQILSAGSATSYTLVSAAAYYGDANRLTTLFFKITTTGSTGTAFLRVPGVGSGFQLGECFTTGTIYGFVPYKMDSSRNIEYLITGGARLSLYAYAYTFDEPT